MKLAELSSLMREGGIVGAGGAGFPSNAKLNERADTVILNCAECEPLLKLHRQVLAKYACEILDAMHEVAVAVGAGDMIVAVKPNYRQTVAALEAELPRFQDKNARLGLLPQVYPSGDEVITIFETTGRLVPPGKLPIEVGCIVFNVETMLNLARKLSENKPVTHKYCTVTGAVKKPVTLRLPLGMTVGEALKEAGGVTVDDYAIISGGPMTGRLCTEYDVITKTSNALIVLPASHYVVQRKKLKTQIAVNRAMSACCHCGTCTDLCSRHMIGYPIDPSRFMNALSAGATGNVTPYVNTFFCSGCNLCEMYSCFQQLSPQSLISVFKGGMRKGGVKMPDIAPAPVDPLRERKLVAHSRLTARLGLTPYNHEALLDEREIEPASVKLMLSQHIGVPCVPLVQKGDRVSAGDRIAQTPEDKLGVSLHSPITGTVTEVTDKYVKVTR